MDDPNEVWFERVPGGTHMPTTAKGLWLTLRYLLLGLAVAFPSAWLTKIMIGEKAAMAAAGVVLVLTILRFSQVAERHSTPK